MWADLKRFCSSATHCRIKNTTEQFVLKSPLYYQSVVLRFGSNDNKIQSVAHSCTPAASFCERDGPVCQPVREEEEKTTWNQTLLWAGDRPRLSLSLLQTSSQTTTASFSPRNLLFFLVYLFNSTTLKFLMNWNAQLTDQHEDYNED